MLGVTIDKPNGRDGLVSGARDAGSGIDERPVSELGATSTRANASSKKAKVPNSASRHRVMAVPQEVVAHTDEVARGGRGHRMSTHAQNGPTGSRLLQTTGAAVAWRDSHGTSICTCSPRRGWRGGRS